MKKKSKMGRPPVEVPREHLVQTRLTDEEYEVVSQAAEAEKRSMASFARAALVERAEKRKQESAQ